jgi:hypothetical protein
MNSGVGFGGMQQAGGAGKGEAGLAGDENGLPGGGGGQLGRENDGSRG